MAEIKRNLRYLPGTLETPYSINIDEVWYQGSLTIRTQVVGRGGGTMTQPTW
jgi:hypothetical protein